MPHHILRFKNLFLCVILSHMLKHIYAISLAGLSMVPRALHATETISNDIFTNQYTLRDNTIVAPNTIISADSVFIESAIWLHNAGHINANIYICDGCDFYIQNSGTLIGNFIPGANSDLLQIISSRNDIKPITKKNHRILINGATDLSLADLTPVATSADSITLRDTTLYYSPELPGVGNWILRGENMLILTPDAIPQSDEFLLLPNISGDGTLRVMLLQDDVLHAAQTYVRNDSVYFYKNRETDYVKILDNDEGRFLNALREHNPTDKLLLALDGAQTTTELHSIMRKSFRLNPGRLMLPIRAFNRTQSRADLSAPRTTNLHSNAGLITTSDTTIYSAGTDLHLSLGSRAGLNLGAYYGYLDGSDSYDDFNGNLYGGKISLQYLSDVLFINSTTGITYSRFETPGILNNAHLEFNVRGHSIYSDADIGMRFRMTNMSAVPYVGADFSQDTILRDNNRNYRTHIGAILSYDACSNCDIAYNYALNASYASDGSYGVTLNTKAWSPFDNAGVNLGVGMFREDNITYYKLSVGAAFWI